MGNTKECRNEHSMNSGWIYRKLCDNWKKYPRNLFSEIEEKLGYILIRDTTTLHPPLTWEANRGYIEKSLREEKYYQGRIKDDKNPPHTEFFMLPQKGGDEYYLIEYGSNFLLTYENDKSNFDFFFALKLLVTDEMKLKEFLTHQLAVNFSDDLSQYKEFVETVLTKHNEFLVNGKIDVIVNKFFQNIFKNENQISKTSQQEQPTATAESPLPQIEKPILEQNKQIANEYLQFLKGYNIQKQKIMPDKEFQKLLDYTFHLIEFEALPKKIKLIPQTNISTETLRYTFYLIHKQLYGTKRIKKVWIDFLHNVFSQFKNSDLNTCYKKK